MDSPMLSEVVILSAARTPMGSFQGSLTGISAIDLGAIAIRGALERVEPKPLDVNLIDECIMGNVLSSGLGQAPARQAAIKAGLPERVTATTVNKVCASGLKAVSLAASSIALGHSFLGVSGGFESMSRAPYYLPRAPPSRVGDYSVHDGLLGDGLTDPYSNVPMGMHAEKCAVDFSIERNQQDLYAVESYRRAKTAESAFANEIVPVAVPGSRKGESPTMFVVDEEISKLRPEKVSTVRPAFKKDQTGTITVVNSSPMSDGAAALVLSSRSFAEKFNLKPVARILGYADAERSPDEFTVAPSDAIPLALQRANVSVEDVDFFEINEAFAVVALANIKLLRLDSKKVNVHGGAVALGHPLGCSGARILVSLLNVLRQRAGRIGVAAICNGGGGATAMVVRMECQDG